MSSGASNQCLLRQCSYGCDPDDFPTAAYIKQFEEAYTVSQGLLSFPLLSLSLRRFPQNPNLTTWVDDYKQPWPKKQLFGRVLVSRRQLFQTGFAVTSESGTLN